MKRISGEEDRLELQEDIEAMERWAASNLMEWNEKKTKIQHIGQVNPKYKYILNGGVIEEETEAKDLGVILPNTASNKGSQFKGHIKRLEAKLGSTIGTLKRILPDLSKRRGGKWSLRIQAYNTWIVPQIIYGAEVWYQGDKARAAMEKTYYSFFKNCHPNPKKRPPLTPEQHIMKQLAITYFKINKGESPLKKEDYFTEITNDHDQISRSKDNRDPMHRGGDVKPWESLTLETRMAKHWCSIPNQVKEGSVNQFRTWIKKNWLSKPEICPSEKSRRSCASGEWKHKSLKARLYKAGIPKNEHWVYIQHASSSKGNLIITRDAVNEILKQKQAAKKKPNRQRKPKATRNTDLRL